MRLDRGVQEKERIDRTHINAELLASTSNAMGEIGTGYERGSASNNDLNVTETKPLSVKGGWQK